MSSTLNDTMNTAKHVMESATGSAGHVMHSAQKGARSSLLGTVTAVGGIVSILRGFDLDEGLDLLGLTRKRTAARSATVSALAFFGVGVALGTGAALLFAPASGAETRRALRGRIDELKRDAEETFERAGAEVKQLEQKAESFVTRAVDTAKRAEHNVENKLSEGVQAAKDVVTSGSSSGYPRTQGGPGTDPRFS